MPYFLSSENPTTNISVTNCISCMTTAYIPMDVKTIPTNIKIPSNLPVSAYADIEVDNECADYTVEDNYVDKTVIIPKKRM